MNCILAALQSSDDCFSALIIDTVFSPIMVIYHCMIEFKTSTQRPLQLLSLVEKMY
jgi:hypothetical protein